MASNFPSSLDAFTNPSSSDAMDSVSVPHASQHSDLNDAVEALQAKVGADSSAVTLSHDYKIAQLESGVTGGKILQVVSTTKTDTFTTTSTSYTDITGLSVSITPTSTSSKILILADVKVGVENVASAVAQVQITGGNSGSYVGDAASNRTQATSAPILRSSAFPPNTSIFAAGFMYLDSPATTSSTTYQVQMKTVAGTVTVNRTQVDNDSAAYSRTASSITVMEVSA